LNSTKRTNTDYFLLILKGAAMGCANKIPGVSGGIVALISGFYIELIESFKCFNLKSFKLLKEGKIKDFFYFTNSKFLFFIFFGVLISFFTISLALDFLIINYEKQVLGWFFGMILSSIYFIFIKIENYGKKEFSATMIGLIFGLSLILIEPGIEKNSLIFILISGFISVSGMVLPGLSGSYLLLVIGNYKLILIDSVNNLLFIIKDLVGLNFAFLNNPDKLFMLQTIIVFTIGSILGLVTLSNLISLLLKQYEKITVSVLVGFIIGTSPSIWPWKEMNNLIENIQNTEEVQISNMIMGKLFFPNSLSIENLNILFFIILGIAIIVILEKYGNKQKK